MKFKLIAIIFLLCHISLGFSQSEESSKFASKKVQRLEEGMETIINALNDLRSASAVLEELMDASEDVGGVLAVGVELENIERESILEKLNATSQTLVEKIEDIQSMIRKLGADIGANDTKSNFEKKVQVPMQALSSTYTRMMTTFTFGFRDQFIDECARYGPFDVLAATKVLAEDNTIDIILEVKEYTDQAFNELYKVFIKLALELISFSNTYNAMTKIITSESERQEKVMPIVQFIENKFRDVNGTRKDNIWDLNGTLGNLIRAQVDKAGSNKVMGENIHSVLLQNYSHLGHFAAIVSDKFLNRTQYFIEVEDNNDTLYLEGYNQKDISIMYFEEHPTPCDFLNTLEKNEGDTNLEWCEKYDSDHTYKTLATQIAQNCNSSVIIIDSKLNPDGGYGAFNAKEIYMHRQDPVHNVELCYGYVTVITH